ncbi:MAG: transglutaminase domain-containing protein [Anaerolineae bacterium]|nr:transglutaminase domain-containing protein [Anaerolineae bacterium]MCA9907524.1 transglutaminase domain-containing protein [Anaerolineae bacterium]
MSEAFYLPHSPITDPGDFARLYDAVPDDIAGICRAVQGLVVHYTEDGYRPPHNRLCEIDTRYAAAILQRILELDDRPLTQPRALEQRLVGCCRDYTVLTVSILRHKGIPARARYGTGTFFEAGYYCDHVILEYWNGSRWVAVDSEMGETQIKHFGITFDVLDVPDDQFVRGGQGWLMCRREGADPDRFGLGSGSPLHGWDFILTEMLLDLAALNRVELLCWDSWGFASGDFALSDDDKTFLDRVAAATLDNARFEECQALFQHEKLRVPDVIQSYSPAVPREQLPVTVHLAL